MVWVEPVQEGVRVDHDAGENQCADRKTVLGAPHGHGTYFRLLEANLVEIFTDSDGTDQRTFTVTAGG